MSQEKIETIKNTLAGQLGKVEREIVRVEVDAHSDAPKETAELGSFSWHLQIQETKRAVKSQLLLSRERIEQALVRMKKGIYGICENCGKQIEEARLNIMPTADLCVSCK